MICLKDLLQELDSRSSEVLQTRALQNWVVAVEADWHEVVAAFKVPTLELHNDLFQHVAGNANSRGLQILRAPKASGFKDSTIGVRLALRR